jgi:deoxyribose-phosphate aldolase
MKEFFDISGYIDHTVLKPTVTEETVIKICQEARENKFASVCIPPVFVKLASRELKKSKVNVCTVIGFPLGYNHPDIKKAEVRKAMKQGAEELDIVVNLTDFKSGKYKKFRKEVDELSWLIHDDGGIVKFILETANLSQEELKIMCDLFSETEVDYVKTSTGFAEKGAQLEDVIYLRKNLPAEIKIKASGGIKSYQDAFSFITNGADRIGTSSGLEIISYGIKEV